MITAGETSCDKEIEGLAKALALEYYRGLYRDRYANPKLLLNYAGPAIAGDDSAAKAWIEEQAADHATTFWRNWIEDAKSLKTEH